MVMVIPLKNASVAREFAGRTRNAHQRLHLDRRRWRRVAWLRANFLASDPHELKRATESEIAALCGDGDVSGALDTSHAHGVVTEGARIDALFDAVHEPSTETAAARSTAAEANHGG